MKQLGDLTRFHGIISNLFDTRDWAQEMYTNTRKIVFKYHRDTAQFLIDKYISEETISYEQEKNKQNEFINK